MFFGDFFGGLEVGWLGFFLGWMCRLYCGIFIGNF